MSEPSAGASTAAPGFETRAIHAGQPSDSATGAVVPPVSVATTFAQPSVGEHPGGYDYSRSGTKKGPSNAHQKVTGTAN